ncbi:MAG: cysteine desulfurase [Myxococcales bacterium]|nr:cysteine desulfurase [Myxococcales bacterium]
MKITYLDYNATSPLCADAKQAVLPFLDSYYENPSSPYGSARFVRKAIQAARRQVAASISALPSEILFTSGGTEATNLAIRGMIASVRQSGPMLLRPHIVTSAVEHSATLDTVRSLEHAGLAEVTVVPVDHNGLWVPETIMQALRPTTILVTVMLANNETGALYPVSALSEQLNPRAVALHVDAVQAYGKIPLDWSQSGWTAMSLSAHKIGGLKGSGALCLRAGSKWVSTMTGGSQEQARRGGTENVLGIVAFGAASSRISDNLAAAPRVLAQRDRLETGLRSFENTTIHAAAVPRLANTTSVRFDGVDAESVIIHLDLQGFCVSAGSACTTGSTRPSHVLTAMGLCPMEAFSTIRISLGPETEDNDIDRLIEALTYLIPKLRHGEN